MKPVHGRGAAVLVVFIIITITMLSGCSGDKSTTYMTSYDVPGIPADIQAVAGDGEVTIRWSPVTGATSYNIYWNTTGSVTTSDSVLISAPSPYVHTGLANGTAYYYVVTAVNIEGESEVSSEASATPVDSSTSNPPSAPAGVTATAGDGQATISWSPVTGATSYNIYWNTTGSVGTSDSAIISAPSPYVHMNLTNGTTYYYAVTAINNDGESALSTEASATPVDSSTSNPPSAPTGVVVTAGDGQVTVSWNPAAGATSYNIYWNTTGSVTTSDSAIISAPSPYVHPNLTNGTTYYYAVTAINNDGESGLSTEVSATPATSAFPPSAPTGVYAIGWDNQITLYWNPVAGAISYNIYWNTTGSVTTSDDAIVNASSPYAHMNLVNGTAYYYVVTAINTNGESAPSNEISSAPVDLTQEIEKKTASDAEAYDRFGWSVSISGDYAVVGARLEDAGGADAGAAYIYHRTGTHSWDGGTKIVASDAQASDQFGFSVSISGDYVVVGAYWEDTGGADAGAAYIFRRTGTNSWDAGTKIVAPDAQASDEFGASVSISGDYAVVGAYGEDAGGSSAGAAYIYHRTGTNSWDGGTKIVASDAQAYDEFGASVSISGDYAVVGARLENAGGSSAGAAYIYHRTGTNSWDGGTKIVASDAQAGDQFGNSVSISGDYAVVGARLEDTGGADAGAAYIYHRTGTNSWDGGTRIVASDAEAGDWFGISVSISGDYAVVGAYLEDTGGTNAGAAYIYHRTGTNSWDGGTRIVASDAEAYDQFGYSVSISGDYAVVGAYLEDAGGADAGAAYIY